MKKIPILPTLVTLGNAFFGFLSIGFVLKAQQVFTDPLLFGRYMGWAGWCILFAMIFDALDGKVARLANATSDFGTQLDSLCDLVSFGVAPAVIIKTLASQQGQWERVGWAASILFVMCAAMRLARFNVETRPDEESHRYFNGLPSPAAAGFVASMTILVHSLRGLDEQEFKGLAATLEPVMDWLLYSIPLVGILLALLMISRVRYVHVINNWLKGQEPLDYMVKVIMVALVAVLAQPFSLPLLLGIYVLTGIISWIKEGVTTHAPRILGPGEE